MWENIELREIRLFLTLADELHFARTAERLGLTTSRVSKGLRDLERKLGEPLLFRTSRRVALTPFGERFRAEVGAAYGRLADVLERSHEAGRGLAGTLRLGVFEPCAGGPHLLEIVQAFEARYPECEVRVTEITHAQDPIAALRSGAVHVEAIRQPLDAPDLISGPTLARDPRVLAVASDHALAGRASVSLEDVADYQVTECIGVPETIMKAYIPERTPLGRPLRRIALSPVHPFELTSLIVRGRVVHPTVPRFEDHFAMNGITLVPIADMPPLLSALVWRANSSGTRLRAFVRTAGDVLRAHAPGALAREPQAR
jgi:DNA-binding transcriptional LysR family regulator